MQNTQGKSLPFPPFGCLPELGLSEVRPCACLAEPRPWANDMGGQRSAKKKGKYKMKKNDYHPAAARWVSTCMSGGWRTSTADSRPGFSGRGENPKKKPANKCGNNSNDLNIH